MHFEKGQTVGIDLGTTFSTIACLDREGNPVALPNEDDEVETASLILLTDDGHVIVGPNHARAAMEAPDHVVQCIKRHMGEAEYKQSFDGRMITPEFLSALILKKLRQDAEKRIGPVGNAVITVPYYFNDARRKATQDAGRIAGLHVVDIINEPTAATLTYAWQRHELGTTDHKTMKPHRALVYDLGGGTFDVTVVQYTPAHFQVLATDGDVQLGGIDWDERLVDYVASEFENRYKSDPRLSPIPLQILRNDCRLAKLALTEQNEVKVNCRFEGKALSVPLSREKFESLSLDLLQRTSDTMDLVLKQADMTARDLDAIVLVGGSTLMPQVQRLIEKRTGLTPCRGVSPHTAVAQGAAIHAAILEAQHRPTSEMTTKIRKMLSSVRQENVNSHGLGVVTMDRKKKTALNHVMIPRNTRLPAEATQMFRTVRADTKQVRVRVTEGDAPDPSACSPLGTCTITDLPPGLPAGTQVQVTYSFDTSGRITVRAKERATGREAAIDIERRSGLTEAQIDTFSQLAQEYKVE